MIYTRFSYVSVLFATVFFIFCLPVRGHQENRKIPEINRLNEIIHNLINNGKYKEAIPFSRKLIQEAQEINEIKSHINLSSLLYLVAEYERSGDFAEANELIDSIIPIYKRHLDPESLYSGYIWVEIGVLIYNSRGNFLSALSFFEIALKIAEHHNAEGKDLMVQTLSGISAIKNYLGDYKKGAEYADRALSICKYIEGMKKNKASLLVSRAIAFTYLGKIEQAEKSFIDAISIFDNIYGEQHIFSTNALDGLGILYMKIGNYTKSESVLNRSLFIIEKNLGISHPRNAETLEKLANVHVNKGEYNLAEEKFKRVLDIQRKVYGPSSPMLTDDLKDLGVLYMQLGQYDHSGPLLEQAFQLDPKTPVTPITISVMSNLAIYAYRTGDFDRSRRLFYQLLKITESNFPQDSTDIASSLLLLGSFLSKSEENDDLILAQKFITRSLKIFNNQPIWLHQLSKRSALIESGNILLRQGKRNAAKFSFLGANWPIGLGKCSLAGGNYTEALHHFTRASTSEDGALKDPQIAAQIGIALALEGLEQYAEATEHFRQAIQLIENQWYTLNPGGKSTFLDGFVSGFKRIDAYLGMVRVLIKLGEHGHDTATRSLEYVERSKSRALLALLARKDALATGEEDSTLLREARKHMQQLYAAEMRMAVVRAQKKKLSPEYFEKVENDYAATKKQHDSFFASLESSHPELASLVTMTEPVKIQKIQALLAKGEVLIEYAYWGTDAWVWVVSADRVQVKRLEISEQELNQALQALSTWEKDTQKRGVVTVSTVGHGAALPGSAQNESPEATVPESLRNLYKALIQPVQPWLEGAEQLIVVPHGGLHRLPFGALYDGAHYLLDQYTVVQAPSSSVLLYMASKRNPDRGSLLAFANPETDKAALPFAEPEVREIASFFPRQNVYLQKEATESRVKEAVHGQDVVHFACHGFFDNKQPLRSALFLSKDDENDGILELGEIFDLALQEANLVTLSACETASAKIQGGDDVVGLSRGFLYAGSSSLLATLWQIDDRSVSLLMRSFYENWRNKGLSKAEALRQAQRSLKDNPRYASPYYWAPFVLIGDWKR